MTGWGVWLRVRRKSTGKRVLMKMATLLRRQASRQAVGVQRCFKTKVDGDEKTRAISWHTRAVSWDTWRGGMKSSKPGSTAQC